MSSQRRRVKGKRPRDESSHGSTPQSFPSIINQSQQTSSYGDSTFSSLQSGPSSTGPPYSQSPTQSPRYTPQPPRGKVAIPALRVPQAPESTQGSKKGRTSHACDYCRKAKAGCTGGQPCTRCKNAEVPCVYGDGKRDREKKKLSQLSRETTTLTQHNSEIIDALRRVRLNNSLSSDDMRTAIDEILLTASTYQTPKEESELQFSPSQPSPPHDDPSGEDEEGSDVGSTGSLDVVHVDTDRDETRATGHLGKASSVAWAQRTAEECDSQTHRESTLGNYETGYTLASYHTEDADVEFVDLSNVYPFDWPDDETANDLVALFFDSVHSILPLLDRSSFMAQYDSFDRGKQRLSTAELVWLGTLNIVFAISAVYGQLIKRHDHTRHHDHLIYLKRAKMLCLDQDLLLQDARVSTARVLGLLCLYFISTCRLNRAWTICGFAIRQALTLALQVRSHAEGLSDYQKEQRLRLWWSLYTLECLLNELTGRPSCISDQDISAPLPMNINEDNLHEGLLLLETSSVPESSSRRTSRASRNSDARPTATYQMPTGIAQPLTSNFPLLSLPITTSTYFIYRIQLSIISHEIVTQLYCAATTKAKWSQVQDTIRRIDHRLLSWCDTLPSEFNIHFDKWTAPDWSEPHILERLGLSMIFNSSRMILYRPCLCRFERRAESRSQESKDFNQEGAQNCIHSARTMISLMHWCASSVEKLYAITPWWNTLHFLCEALSVLMLEMAFQAQHLPSEAAEILNDAKNGVRWLRNMAGESVSARKAWEIFDCLVRLVAPMISWSVYDMPTEAPIPPGYNWRRFNAAHTALPTRQLQQQEKAQENEQLSEADLQQLQYNVSQPSGDQNASTSTWNQNEGFTFTTPAHPHTEFGFGTGVYAHQGPGYERVPNPLDHGTALELFGSIGRVHGHYDEPWQHMFASGLGELNEDVEMGEPSEGIGFSGYGAGFVAQEREGDIDIDTGQGQVQGGEEEYKGFGI